MSRRVRFVPHARALAAAGMAAPLALWLVLAAGPVAAAGAADARQADTAVYVHLATPGDTLIGLGQRLLTQPAAWPQLQRLNRIRDPRRIPVGSELLIPLALMRTEAAPATVASTRGDARLGGQPLAAGQSVTEGSQLSTGADGQVTLRLVDGTQLRLRSGSRLHLDLSRRLPGADSSLSGVQLDEGRLEAQTPVRPARGGRPGFRVNTPQGVLAVRGTEFRVGSDAQGTRGEVLQGVVAVSGRVQGAAAGAGDAAASEVRLAAGYGTVIDARGRVAAPQPLLSPPDVSGLPALHERPLVRLTLPVQPGATGYRVQVAADDGFDQLLADVSATVPELRIAGLDDGRYRMRVRAVGAQGVEGLDAPAVLTLKARPEPPLPRAPAPDGVIRGRQVQLAWAASSQAQRYRLQMRRADADGAAPLHDLPAVEGLTHTLEAVEPGRYVWRVGSVRASGDAGPWGDALSFEVKALPPTPGPPAPPEVGDDTVRFFWQRLPGQTFEFHVARDAAFSQVVHRQDIDGTSVELPLPGTGRFHVRLRARDADGFVGPWSASQHFDVTACVRDSQQACVRVEGAKLQLQ